VNESEAGAPSSARSGMPRLPDGRILIVDDDQNMVALLEQLLRLQGHEDVHTATDPLAGLTKLGELAPDLVFVDFHMPEMDGLEFVSLVRATRDADEYLPIVMLTADASHEARREALRRGATDFLTKPFDITEVALRARNLLTARSLHLRLEQRVAERTRDLEEAGAELLDRLAIAAEFRDDQTGRHTQRVGRNAAALAQAMGLSPPEVDALAKAAPLHDLGKIGLSDRILRKQGDLTAEEFAHVKGHTVIGAKILSASRSKVLRLAHEIAWGHHERWDGSGYPRRLRGAEIPVPARIVSVVDVFDALMHVRPYKLPWPVERARDEIIRNAGVQFDPEIVAAFVEGLDAGLFPPDHDDDLIGNDALRLHGDHVVS
jgi:putative two-component system response regulator